MNFTQKYTLTTVTLFSLLNSSLRVIVSFQFILIFAIIDYGQPQYGDYVYPEWAQLIGWLVFLLVIGWIPGVAIYQICKQNGNIKQVIYSQIPPDLKKNCGSIRLNVLFLCNYNWVWDCIVTKVIKLSCRQFILWIFYTILSFQFVNVVIIIVFVVSPQCHSRPFPFQVLDLKLSLICHYNSYYKIIFTNIFGLFI